VSRVRSQRIPTKSSIRALPKLPLSSLTLHHRAGILFEGLGSGGEVGVLSGVSSGNYVIGIGRVPIATPGDNGHSAVTDVASECYIRMEDAAGVELLCDLGPALTDQMQAEGTLDAFGRWIFPDLDGLFLGRAEAGIGPDSKVYTAAGDGQRGGRSNGSYRNWQDTRQHKPHATAALRVH